MVSFACIWIVFDFIGTTTSLSRSMANTGIKGQDLVSLLANCSALLDFSRDHTGLTSFEKITASRSEPRWGGHVNQVMSLGFRSSPELARETGFEGSRVTHFSPDYVHNPFTWTTDSQLTWETRQQSHSLAAAAAALLTPLMETSLRKWKWASIKSSGLF